MPDESGRLTPEELQERQERLATALLTVATVVEDLADHAGFSPGRALHARVISILDPEADEAPDTKPEGAGKPAVSPSMIPPPPGPGDDDEDE